MRGMVTRERYTGEVQFKPSPEVGTRLAKQLTKMALGVAIFDKADHITEHAYSCAVNVARDTAPDREEEIVRQMYLRRSEDYASTKEIAGWTRLPSATVIKVMQDMNILHLVAKESAPGIARWRLSQTLLRLMRPLHIYKEEVKWRRGRKHPR
jgi:hypothetical protein